MPSDFDNMSDLELREQYATLFPGRPVPPITATTKTPIIKKLKKAERGEYHSDNSPSPSRNRSIRVSTTNSGGRNLRNKPSEKSDESSVHESRRRTPPRAANAPRSNSNEGSPGIDVAEEKVAPIKSRKATPPRVSSTSSNKNSSRTASSEASPYTPSNAEAIQNNTRQRSVQASSNGGRINEPDSSSAYSPRSKLARPAIWKSHQVTPDNSSSRAAMDSRNRKLDSSYKNVSMNTSAQWSKFLGYFALALIFLLLGLAIFYQGNDDLIVQKCSVSGVSRVSCVPDAEVATAVEIYKAVYGMLKEHALDEICKRGEEYVGKSKQEVADFMKEEFNLASFEVDDMVSNIKIIAKEYSQGLIKVDSGRFYANNVNLPFFCKIRHYFSYVKHFTVGGVVLLAIYLWFSYRRKCQQRYKRKVSELIDNIVAILRRNAETSRNPFMPLNHVRDQLIPTSERQKMKKFWDEAVNYVNTSDSRIRREVQSIHGEDYYVWRWLAAPSFASPQPAPSSGGGQLSTRKRGWHGEAFATTQGTINSPFTSPTCCLKVRNMFDPAKEEVLGNNDWSSRIRNEILERCEDSDIVHVGVVKDSKEGVVYVKCASMEDAGNAYRRLHGAWFDDQILHVKYIRAERYTERFPESQYMVEALQRS